MDVLLFAKKYSVYHLYIPNPLVYCKFSEADFLVRPMFTESYNLRSKNCCAGPDAGLHHSVLKLPLCSGKVSTWTLQLPMSPVRVKRCVQQG